MKLQHLIFASLFSLAACGGGSKKPDTTPTPDPAPTADTAQTPPEAEKAPPAEAPAPPPPAPKFALGEAKITMKAKSKGETMTGDIAIAADGSITATTTSSKKKQKKTVAGKLTAMGELQDDKGEVIARIDDAGKVEARQQSEVTEDGKVMKSETKYEDVGDLDETGTFTSRKDGTKLSIDDKGKLVGFPAEMQFTVTAAPEQRKAAMFVVIAMFSASKVTTGTSSSKAAVAPAPAPAPKK